MSDFNNNLLSLITMFLQQKTEAPAFSLEFLQRYKQGNEPVQGVVSGKTAGH
jgi:hypothetical protein